MRAYGEAEWKDAVFLDDTTLDTGVSEALETLAAEVKQRLAFFMLLFFCQPIL